MLDLVVVGGRQVGAHAAVVARDDDPAAAGRFGGGDPVLGAEAGGGACGAEDRGILVGPDAANVKDRRRREDVLHFFFSQKSKFECGVFFSPKTRGGVATNREKLGNFMNQRGREREKTKEVPERLERYSALLRRQSVSRRGSAKDLRRGACVSPRRGWRRWA